MSDRVLIVDDNPTNLKIVAYLVKANGYDVDTAVDADAAIAAIAANRPRVIRRRRRAGSRRWRPISPASTPPHPRNCTRSTPASG